MNLSDYKIFPCPYADAFELIHQPTGEVLLTTQRVSLDTVLRIALNHNLKRG